MQQPNASARLLEDPTIPTLKLCAERAFRVRKHVVSMATNGGCFLGASLSCVDILTVLYTHSLRIDARALDDPNRDYLLLSKGHDVPALYGLFVELGILARQRLNNHLSTTDDIYWHPNRHVPGVEFHSGSLGHLLAVGAGIAMDLKLSNNDAKVVVILGDGELNEGSVWEAILVAAAKQLDNLVAIVDRNRYQANVATEELIPLEPLPAKFEAFGWRTARVDGHDHAALMTTFDEMTAAARTPCAIIADTVRGKGLPSLENRPDRWFCNFTPEEIQDLLNELDGADPAHLHTGPVVVR